MADIRVKPKRTGTPWWLWVVLALALLALVWFALDLFGDDEVEIDDREEVDVGAARVIGAAPLAFPLTPAHLNLTR